MGDSPVLFISGPTEVDEELRQIMSMPLLGHRDPKFVATVQDVCRQLQPLFLTERREAAAFGPAQRAGLQRQVALPALLEALSVDPLQLALQRVDQRYARRRGGLA